MELSRRRQYTGVLCYRIERGGNARRPGDEMALAQEASTGGEGNGQAEPGVRSRTYLLAALCALLRCRVAPGSLRRHTPSAVTRRGSQALRRQYHWCGADAGRHLYPAI